MSTIKRKTNNSNKTSHKKTLDEIHKEYNRRFLSERNELPEKKEELKLLKIELEELNNTNLVDVENIGKKSRLRQKIKEIERDIFDIENSVNELEYYSETADFIVDYYKIINEGTKNLYEEHPELKQEKGSEDESEEDIINPWNQHVVEKKKIPRKKNKMQSEQNKSILDFFNIQNVENNDNHQNKAKLLENYKNTIDSTTRKIERNEIRWCDNCNIDKILILSDGIFLCEECGDTDLIIIDSDKPNFKDYVSNKSAFPYKRSNHFSDWLSGFQAKESTEIPPHIYADVVNELKKMRYSDFEKEVTISVIRSILKKLQYPGYYEHSMHILTKITKKTPPFINREVEKELKKMFEEIQEPFERNKPPDRANFLSYSYILRKFFQLLEMDEYVESFKLLKDRDKLRKQDYIWKKICEDLRWEFIPSI